MKFKKTLSNFEQLSTEKKIIESELSIIDKTLRPYEIIEEIEKYKYNLKNLEINELLFVLEELESAETYFVNQNNENINHRIKTLRQNIERNIVKEIYNEIKNNSNSVSGNQNIKKALKIFKDLEYFEINFLRSRKIEVERNFIILKGKIQNFIIEILKREIFLFFKIFNNSELFEMFLASILKNILPTLERKELLKLNEEYKNKNLEENNIKHLIDDLETGNNLDKLAETYFYIFLKRFLLNNNKVVLEENSRKSSQENDKKEKITFSVKSDNQPVEDLVLKEDNRVVLDSVIHEQKESIISHKLEDKQKRPDEYEGFEL